VPRPQVKLPQIQASTTESESKISDQWSLSVGSRNQVTVVFNHRYQVGVLGWSLSSCTTDSTAFTIST